MRSFISAVIVAVLALPALAAGRGGKAFNTVNGRSSAATRGTPRVYTVTSPGGSAATNAVASRSQTNAHGSAVRAARGGSKTFWSGAARKVDGGEEAPPNFNKPGALIRTTGQLPVYEKTTTTTHSVDAGEIMLNERQAIDVGRAPSIRMGKADATTSANSKTNSGGAAANSGPDAPAGGASDGFNAAF